MEETMEETGTRVRAAMAELTPLVAPHDQTLWPAVRGRLVRTACPQCNETYPSAEAALVAFVMQCSTRGTSPTFGPMTPHVLVATELLRAVTRSPASSITPIATIATAAADLIGTGALPWSPVLSTVPCHHVGSSPHNEAPLLPPMLEVAANNDSETLRALIDGLPRAPTRLPMAVWAAAWARMSQYCMWDANMAAFVVLASVQRPLVTRGVLPTLRSHLFYGGVGSVDNGVSVVLRCHVLASLDITAHDLVLGEWDGETAATGAATARPVLPALSMMGPGTCHPFLLKELLSLVRCGFITRTVLSAFLVGAPLPDGRPLGIAPCAPLPAPLPPHPTPAQVLAHEQAAARVAHAVEHAIRAVRTARWRRTWPAVAMWAAVHKAVHGY